MAIKKYISSSITQADVYAVLQSFIREIPRIISRGSIVRLGNFGSFRLSTKTTPLILTFKKNGT